MWRRPGQGWAPTISDKNASDAEVLGIEGEIVAVFTVSDVNTRRLLEAESGVLRAQLEGKGMRVQRVSVELVE